MLLVGKQSTIRSGRKGIKNIIDRESLTGASGHCPPSSNRAGGAHDSDRATFAAQWANRHDRSRALRWQCPDAPKRDRPHILFLVSLISFCDYPVRKLPMALPSYYSSLDPFRELFRTG